jgi:uncharacterized protein YndB with AHSA1/START domain
MIIPFTISIIRNMAVQKFSIEIHAPRERVWQVLWNDTTFRDWANNIDEGTYLEGELKEGNEVQFMSASSGYGVTSVVEKLVPNEFISFRHTMDTKESGERERDEEWAGGVETYALSKHDDITSVTITSEVPPSLEKIMAERTPKALARIKVLAENGE